MAGYGAFKAIVTEQTAWFLTLGVLALLFNPIIPVALGRELWQTVDVIAAIVVLTSGFSVPEKPQAGPSGR